MTKILCDRNECVHNKLNKKREFVCGIKAPDAMHYKEVSRKSDWGGVGLDYSWECTDYAVHKAFRPKLSLAVARDNPERSEGLKVARKRGLKNGR